ncbi:RPA-interacting protein isoform X3 [Papio anubis]|uniref:RPA-interacting protein isoform X3 n=1 Tax=Papio anubis TaxID=9555 RepID=UPI0004F226CB|nr:RPA-interacting protein isoform X3 [Papio anubis]
MAESLRSPRRSLYKLVGSPPWKETFRQLEELIDMAVLEEIQQELIDQEQSIIREYEKSLQFDEKCLSIMLAEWEANPLVCPVCTKYNLRITSGVVVCQCGLSIPSHSSELTEQKLRACLEGSINEHSAHCPHTPEFSVTGGTEEKSSLLMSCLIPGRGSLGIRSTLYFRKFITMAFYWVFIEFFHGPLIPNAGNLQGSFLL